MLVGALVTDLIMVLILRQVTWICRAAVDGQAAWPRVQPRNSPEDHSRTIRAGSDENLVLRDDGHVVGEQVRVNP